MLRSLGAEEIRSVLAERGQVEVRCDFCNRAYRFDPVDVETAVCARHRLPTAVKLVIRINQLWTECRAEAPT